MASRFCSIPYAHSRIVLAAALFATGAVSAATPGTPLSPAFAVQDPNDPDQTQPAVAHDGHGNYVVVWNGGGVILGRRYDANSAPLDGGFQISADLSFETFPNVAPQVAMDAAGDFVVTWQNTWVPGFPVEPVSSGTARAWARRYSADGVPAGPAFMLEPATSTFTQGPPAVAMDAEGDFVLAWERASRSAQFEHSIGHTYSDLYIHLDNRQIVAQRFDHNGAAQGARLTAGSRPGAVLRFSDSFSDVGPVAGTRLGAGFGGAVDVAMDTAGDFVVAWGGNSYGLGYFDARAFSINGGGAISTINARRYNAAGKSLDLLPQTLDTTLAFATTKSAPSLAMDAAGNYVVAWSEANGLTNPTAAVYARRFDAKALRQGAQIKVGATPVQPGMPLVAPSVSADHAGDFAIAWAPTTSQINASRYSASGTALGPALVVATSAGSAFGVGPLSGPVASSDAAGNFVIGWQIDLSAQNHRVVLRSYAGP